jgi:DNA-binding XRE family transcriptional regulator
VSPSKFKAIRENLGLNQDELAQVLGLSGKTAVSNIETGVRNPNKLAMAVMEILNESSPRRAKELIELLKTNVARLEKGRDA